MSARAYPAYQQSGVVWIGNVPKHWKVLQIKRLSPVLRGASPRPIDDPKYFDDEGSFAWVRIADVSSSDGRLRGTTQRLSDLGSSLSVKLQPGCLFLSIAGSVGKPCISEIQACIHDGFVYFPRLAGLDEYLYRIFEAGLCYAGLGKFGTQLNLNTDTVGSIAVPLPSDDEITSILGFLDRETEKIDALVVEQELLIALLKEKRQAVISQAVTKGLDPAVPMKHSGVEWLGEVPAHWKAARVSKCSMFITSGPRGWSESITEDGALFFQSGDIGDDLSVDSKNAKRVSIQHGVEAQRSEASNGDVVVCITGAKTGNVGVVSDCSERAYINQHLSLIRPTKTVRSDFLGFSLKSDAGQKFLEASQYGLKQGLSLDDIKSVPIAIPPLEEQDSILIYIWSALDRIADLNAEAQRAIVLLRERRAALIAAAVTGKIDVREHVDVLSAQVA